MKTTAAAPAPLAAKDRVKVYQKPLTRDDYEGIAKLVRLHAVEQQGWERWIVRFAGESANAYRLVHADDRVEGLQHERILPKSAHRGNGKGRPYA